MIDHFCQVWLDTSAGKNKRTLTECIQAAQASHKRRTGEPATVCYINSDAYLDAPAVIEGVHIRRDKGVQPNQYWMAANGAKVEPTPEPEPVEEAEPVIVKQSNMIPEYICQQCGCKWTVPMAWCANCGYDGKEAA